MNFSTRSKNPDLWSGDIIDNNKMNSHYISIASIKNYVYNDHLIDWISEYEYKYDSEKAPEIDLFNLHIKKRYLNFKEQVKSRIKEKGIELRITKHGLNVDGVRETENYMNEKVPIIMDAHLINKRNHTYGTSSMIILNSHIVDFFGKELFPNIDKCTYIVVLFNISKVKLCKDNIHIKNDKKYVYEKTKCYLYTKALKNNRYGIILGKNFTFGIIDFEFCDKKCVNISKKSLQWIRKLKIYGSKWSIDPPSINELYPNMCVNSGHYNYKKYNLSSKNKEITSVWNVSAKHRNKLLEKGITSWDDIRCNSESMCIKGKNGLLVDKILNINRQSEYLISKDILNLNYLDWKNETAYEDIFIDFETIPDPEIIFMIGVYWRDGDSWKYKSFICKELTKDYEYSIIHKFLIFMKMFKNHRLWYWSAESIIWKNAIKRHNLTNNLNLVDLVDVFKNEQIVLKDCFTFKLKHIASVMEKYSMIKIKLESECVSGKSAFVQAINYYKNKNYDIIKDIEKYNSFDVISIKQILFYLREKY